MLSFYAKKYVGISNLFFAYPNIYYRTGLKGFFFCIANKYKSREKMYLFKVRGLYEFQENTYCINIDVELDVYSSDEFNAGF